MSKKDYQAIAAAIYAAKTAEFVALGDRPSVNLGWARHGMAVMQARITDALAADNPRFDRARFLEACETGHCKGMRKVGS